MDYSQSSNGLSHQYSGIEQGERKQPRHWNGTTSPWDDERIELLKKYHGEGLSMTLIADQINHDTKSSFSRNAIIGKAQRIGLPGRASSITVGGRPKKIGARTHRVRRPKFNTLGPELVELELPSPDHLAVNFFDLQKDHCRFIKDDTFCGQNVAPESSWCPFHHRLVYRRPTRPERLAA